MRWMILWLLTTLVATCGQKGPLYLPEPEKPEQPEQPEKPEQTEQMEQMEQPPQATGEPEQTEN